MASLSRFSRRKKIFLSVGIGYLLFLIACESGQRTTTYRYEIRDFTKPFLIPYAERSDTYTQWYILVEGQFDGDVLFSSHCDLRQLPPGDSLETDYRKLPCYSSSYFCSDSILYRNDVASVYMGGPASLGFFPKTAQKGLVRVVIRKEKKIKSIPDRFKEIGMWLFIKLWRIDQLL
jgi:hypothetical protein